MNENFDVLILFSGGADSRLMVELARDLKLKTYCVLIDYGQAHVAELDYAKDQLNELNIPYHVVEISGLAIRSILTSGDKNLYNGVSPFNVPGRNLIFLSIAYGIAESMGIEEIWYGPDFSDRIGLFPDCYQEWVVKVDELFKMNGSKKINVRAPLLGFTKDMVTNLLRNKYGVSEDDIYSGYGEIKV